MSTRAETHWPACTDVGLQNLEASSPLCLGPHALFILLCSEFWEYRSSQLCLTAGHGEGSFHNPLELLRVCWPLVSIPLCIPDIPFPSELLSHVWYCQCYCSRLQCAIMQKLLLQLSSVLCTFILLAGDFLDDKHLHGSQPSCFKGPRDGRQLIPYSAF